MLTLLLACAAPDTDSADPTDTDTDTDADSDADTDADTDTDTDTDTDPLNLGSQTFDGHGCQWAYITGVATDAAIAMRLILPTADRDAMADVSYSRPLAAEEHVRLVSGPGKGSVEIFDCSDLSEGFDGHQWDALSGTLSVVAIFDRTGPANECTGGDPNYYYDAVVTLTDVLFEDTTGAQVTQDVPALSATIGWNGCGG